MLTRMITALGMTLFLATALAACGGGSGDGDEPATGCAAYTNMSACYEVMGCTWSYEGESCIDSPE